MYTFIKIKCNSKYNIWEEKRLSLSLDLLLVESKQNGRILGKRESRPIKQGSPICLYEMSGACLAGCWALTPCCLVGGSCCGGCSHAWS